jgi:hypothetical protein
MSLIGRRLACVMRRAGLVGLASVSAMGLAGCGGDAPHGTAGRLDTHAARSTDEADRAYANSPSAKPGASPGAAALWRGQALFQGDAALPASLAGHVQALPTAATRCVNCHGASDTGAAARAANNAFGAGAGAEAGAGAGAGGGALPRTPPALGRAGLAVPRVRRGGPPSAYDAAALCTLLRSGVDPAQVVIPGAMPRYGASDAQCADLWAYLVAQP